MKTVHQAFSTKKIFTLVMIAFLLGLANLSARTLDLKGETFPIWEESLLESIRNQAAASGLDAEDLAKKTKEYLLEPTPTPNLSLARKKRSFAIDPSIEIEESIQAAGKILAQKGDRINPLDAIHNIGTLLFFDGSDPRQVAWAKKQAPDATWILIKGSPLVLEEQEERPVFFDQFGAYTARCGIQHYPAKVTQKGNLLWITETPPKEILEKN